MQYHKQLNKHAPENGIFGDCYRTAIACIIDKHPRDVPHFYDLDNGRIQSEKMVEYLRDSGIRMIHTAYKVESIKDVLKVGKANFGGLHYVLSGMGDRDVNHCVVCVDDKLLHDPHNSDSFLNGPCEDGLWHVEIIVRPI